MCIKLGRKISIFSIFSKQCVIYAFCLRRLTDRLQKVGDFLETFPPQGVKFFYRGLSKGSLELHCWSYGGATYTVRQREGGPHTCI